MRLVIALAVSVLPSAAHAGDAEIVDARAQKQGGTWRFDVTVLHGDTGWDHYADGWRIIDQDGTELGYRKLLHPHVDEQPFTRSLSGVAIPAGTKTVTVEVHDSVHGWAEKTFTIDLN